MSCILKNFGSFTPHFSNNNFFTGWYLLTRIAMGPWPVDRFCLGRLWSWSRVQSREKPHQIFSKRQIGITAPWIHHGDVIKWKHFLPLLASCEGIHRAPVDSPHGGQWRRALMFCLICAINKRRSKQSRRRWFETPSRSWWRHCIDLRKINMSVWSKRNAFSKGHLWSQLNYSLRACSISCILKMYWLLYATLFQ